MAHGALEIGEVAELAGVGPKAIRFYEGRGVIAPPARGENGYRQGTGGGDQLRDRER